ncbi:AAA family ATPase [Methanosarcinales archaeon]|nr:MAG: AAA family ATPase [Methanosarcinales archaeon]
MALPINIRDLINGRTVEWERIEFKRGWNPVPTMHNICAFANDFNDWGGGYIIIGIEDDGGRPVLPPVGVPLAKIDAIQKELLEICYKLRPHYVPIVEPVDFQDEKILLIWAPRGSNRPYKAPEKLSKGSVYIPYIRHYSVTKKASLDEERELLLMANQIPFDDRLNHRTAITDLNLTLIKSHLAETKSALLSESTDLPFSDLCRRMNIAERPDEYLKPKNVGLLFFNEHPERFFRGTQIDIVEFEDEIGDRFTEKTFTGPIQQQIISTLTHLKNNVVTESVRKVPGQAEAIRFFNYPYEAIEEAVVNALYHRSYQGDSPVEVRIFPKRIEIISYPGPLLPLNKDNLNNEHVTARRYRNRRIGDFLKELHLTEGRGTGFPKIKRAMKENGSPEPVFETDGDRNYFMMILAAHPDARVSEQVSEQDSEQVIQILEFCRTERKKQDILNYLNLSPVYRNYKRHILPLLQNGLLAFTIPDKPRSRLQKYSTTGSGLAVLKHRAKNGEDGNHLLNEAEMTT